jgi:hypothetical protein
VILYLNTLSPECGGETVFPHQPDVGAALLARGITHTTMKIVQGMDRRKGTVKQTIPAETSSLLAAAEAVCSSEPTPAGAGEQRLLVRRSGTGLGLCPEQGLAIVFFTRHKDVGGGAVDPASWHGGADTQGAEKWILQKFKSVPRGAGSIISEVDIQNAACAITGKLVLKPSTGSGEPPCQHLS